MRVRWLLGGLAMVFVGLAACSGSSGSSRQESGMDASGDGASESDSSHDATNDTTGGGSDAQEAGSDALQDVATDSDAGHDAPDDTTNDVTDDTTGVGNDAREEGMDAQLDAEAGSHEAGWPEAGAEGSVDAGRDIDVPDVTFDDAAGDAGVCNSLVNTAPVLTIAAVSGTLPTGKGGTVLPGLYYATSATAYLRDAGVPEGGAIDAGLGTFQETMVLEPPTAAGIYPAAVVVNTDGPQQTENETLAFSGNTVTIGLGCGAFTSSGPVTYTVDGGASRVHIYIENVGGFGLDVEITYDLQ